MSDNDNDSQASGADITPEDFDGDQVTPKADQSPDTNSEDKSKDDSKSEAPKEPAASEDESGKDSEDAAADETPEEGADEGESKPKGSDTRKDGLNTEIRDLVAKRNELKREVSEANAQVYQPASEEELVEQGMSESDAKVEALKQQFAVRDYNDRVAEAQLTLESESDRVLREFSWANPDSDEFNKDLAAEAADMLNANLLTDKNTGQVVGSNMSPYQIYKTLNTAIAANSVREREAGQKSTEEMLANADEGASKAPAKKSVSQLDTLWADPL